MTIAVNLMNTKYIHVESLHTEKYVRTRYRQSSANNVCHERSVLHMNYM